MLPDDHPAFLYDAERTALQADIVDNPELQTALDEWARLRVHLGHSLDALIPSRQLLVLYALEQAGMDAAPSARERTLLEDERDAIRAALDVSPALQRIGERIVEDARLFEEYWNVQVDPAPEAEARTDRPPARRQRRRRASSPYGWVAIAVALVGMVSWFAWQRTGETTIVAGPGEIRAVELPDGSRVRLMEESQLTFVRPRAAEVFERTVRLDGKALFEVLPGERKFIVETPGAETVVYGTTFGVEARNGETRVVLAEGEVEVVDAEGRRVRLDPGQMSQVEPAGAGPSAPSAIDVTDALEWSKLFVFRATEVQDIADRLSRHYGVEIAVDLSLQTEPLTATYEHSWRLSYILQTLASTLDAEVVQAEDGAFELRPVHAFAP